LAQPSVTFLLWQHVTAPHPIIQFLAEETLIQPIKSFVWKEEEGDGHCVAFVHVHVCVCVVTETLLITV
jgi:hypothetical protein